MPYRSNAEEIVVRRKQYSWAAWFLRILRLVFRMPKKQKENRIAGWDETDTCKEVMSDLDFTHVSQFSKFSEEDRKLHDIYDVDVDAEFYCVRRADASLQMLAFYRGFLVYKYRTDIDRWCTLDHNRCPTPKTVKKLEEACEYLRAADKEIARAQILKDYIPHTIRYLPGSKLADVSDKVSSPEDHNAGSRSFYTITGRIK